MKTKAQAGVEGMIALGIVLFLFIGVYVISQTKQADVVQSDEELQEHADCLRVANGIVNAVLLGENARITVNIRHNFTIYPSEQRMEGERTFCTIPVKSISRSGSPSSSPFAIEVGEVLITHLDWIGVQNG